MRFQDQVVKSTQRALGDVCRAALAVPEAQRAWAPGGEARSTLDQMQEIAMAANWFLPIVRERRVPEFDGHAAREAVRLRRSFDTVERCIEAAQESMATLCEAIAEFPDEALEDELTVPFGGGMVMTLADVLEMPRWNLIYHLGQINQIQLMLGDKDMH